VSCGCSSWSGGGSDVARAIDCAISRIVSAGINDCEDRRLMKVGVPVMSISR
jgi:hypothetical protein